MSGATVAGKQAVVNLKNGTLSMEQLESAMKKSTLAMVGAKIATVAFNAALTFGLSFAISKVAEGIDNLIHKEEKEAKAARERAEKAKETIDKIDEETKSIAELIDRYKELKSAGNLDKSGLEEVRDIQNQITNLVGNQVEGLDLVNGRLDIQIEKLKSVSKIIAKRNLEDSELAVKDIMNDDVSKKRETGHGQIYGDAKNLSKNDLYAIRDVFVEAWNKQAKGSGFEMELSNEANIKQNDYNIAYYDDKKKNLDISVELGSHVIEIETLDKAIDYYRNNVDNYLKEDVYNKLVKYRGELNEQINKVQSGLSSVISSELLSSDFEKTEISSINDYIDLRNKIIQQLLNNDIVQRGLAEGYFDAEQKLVFDENGEGYYEFISSDWLSEQIDNYLGGLDQFSEYYNIWWKQFGSDTAKGVAKVKKSISEDLLNPSGQNVFNEWIDSLSEAEQEKIVERFNEGGTEGWGLSRWKAELERLKPEIKEDVSEISNMFNDLMNETGTDKDPSFIEKLGKETDKLNTLTEALNKVESDAFTSKDRAKLFKDFPQLIQYSDNLGAGIRNLISEMRSDVVSEFDEKIAEFKKNGAADEDISSLEKLRDIELDIIDTSVNVQEQLKNIQNIFKDLDSIVKDYNENQYFSLESLEKLSSSAGQRYLSYLSYENGQLKINEEAYKKLVLAQIDEIETKATLQATTDLQSLTDETAAKEYLAKVNIDLAQSQLTAAQAAFQYQLALKLAEGGNVAKAAQKVADNLNSLRNIFASARSQVDDYAAAMLGATSATEKKAKASEKAKSALESEQRALEHSKKALEDEKKALEDTKSEYEKAQKAIEDLIKWTQNYIKQIKEDEVKALQDKKEKFDELIEKQKESLQAEKDLHDYEKSVGEKQNDLASNALKVSVTSLDDSGAGKKAYKKAQEEYKKSKTDMEDFLYDHSIETREKALDQLKEDTDKSYDEQIKTIQDYLSNEVQLYRDACKMIDNDNGTLYGELLNYCLTYTTTGKKEFDHMWSLAQTAMEKYNVVSVGTMQFMDELKGRIYDVDGAIDAVSKNIESYENRISAVKTQLDNLKDAAVQVKNALDGATSDINLKSDKLYSVTYGEQTYTSKDVDWIANRILSRVPYTGSKDNALRLIKSAIVMSDIKQKAIDTAFGKINAVPIKFNSNNYSRKGLQKYASGTRSAKSSIAQINENGLETLMRKTPDGDFVIMNQDDKVYTEKQTDNLYDFSGNPEQFFAKLADKGLSPLSQEELANLGLWGDSSQLGMINSAFGVGGLSGLIEKITGGSGVSTNNESTTNDINPIVNIYIQGNADQSVINALEKQADSIVQRTINQIMKIPVRNKFVI